MLTEKFKNVGKVPIPTLASASIFKCSKRTSLVGIAIPSPRNPHKKRQPLQKIQVKY